MKKKLTAREVALLMWAQAESGAARTEGQRPAAARDDVRPTHSTSRPLRA